MDDSDLRCSICHKQPKFSDVSHLLTHVASKAHLANVFELGVRKTNDPEAARLLETYENWFNYHNIRQLLSDRLASKERRKKRRSENNAMSLKARPIHGRGFTTAPSRSNTVAVAPISHCLDPRLAGPYNGPQEEALSPVTPSAWTAVNSNEKTRTGPVLRSMRPSAGAYLNMIKLEDEDQSTTDSPAMYPLTPTQPRRKKAAEEITWDLRPETPEPIVTAPRARALGNEEKPLKSRSDEIARLKGVLWPGMDCFDAATDHMRRRRNQKKDGTVLKQMEIGSLLVEPNEMIFSPGGGLLKERVITGNPEDDSPLKGETPIPRRRQTRSQNILASNDPNLTHAADRTRQRVAARKANKTVHVGSPDQYKPSHRRGMMNPQPSHASFDGDFEMTVNAFGKRARGGFDVFTDEEEGSKQPYPTQGMDGRPKGQIDSLTPTRLMLDRKPAPSGTRARKVARTTADKENIEPILNARGQISNLQDWNSPFAKHATGPGTFDHYLNEPSFPDLGSYTDSDKPVYRSNPLFASKHSAYDNPFKSDYGARHDEWSPTAPLPASEETIPEEHLEYSGLYLLSAD